MDTLFGNWLEVTKELQVTSYGTDPATLRGEARAEFARWNVLAAEHELHEFLDELQWKPWANNQGAIADRDHAVEELVDVLHFVANLAVLLDVSDEEINEVYVAKVQKNRDRQARPDGYDSRKFHTGGIVRPPTEPAVWGGFIDTPRDVPLHRRS